MVRPVYLLYTLPVRDSSDLRMSDPRVLRNLAEQILAVDWLQSPSKQAIEVKPSLRELYFLPSVTHWITCSGERPLVELKHLEMPSNAPGPATTNSASSKSSKVE